jgi:hypothetical protein
MGICFSSRPGKQTEHTEKLLKKKLRAFKNVVNVDNLKNFVPKIRSTFSKVGNL